MKIRLLPYLLILAGILFIALAIAIVTGHAAPEKYDVTVMCDYFAPLIQNDNHTQTVAQGSGHCKIYRGRNARSSSSGTGDVIADPTAYPPGDPPDSKFCTKHPWHWKCQH